MSGAASSAKRIALSPLGFWSGLTYPFRGMHLVYFKERGLARIWAIPIVLTLLAFVAVGWASIHYYADLAAMLLPDDIATAGSFWERAWDVSRSVIDVAIGLLLFTVGFVAVVFMATVFAAPFNDALSEAVERRVANNSSPPFSFSRMARDLARTVGLELAKLIFYAALMLPLLVSSLFIPIVGQVTAVVSFVLTALYFAVDYIDWPAARRAWSVRDRVALLRAQWPPLLGFGVGVWALLFIPVVNLFFMPAAVAGGTLLFLRLEQKTQDLRDFTRL